MHIENGIVYADNRTPPLKVCGVQPLDNHRLWLQFSNGDSGIFDFTPLLDKPAFVPLKNKSIFNSVYIDYGCPVWCNGDIDIAPEYLHKHCIKDIDHKTAEYFANGRIRITKVVPNDDFTLTLTFDNGETRLYDTKSFLKPGTVFEPFMNIENFKRVYLDDTHCVCWDIDPSIDSNEVWNNKVDICPDGCYIDSVPITGGSSNA